MTDRKGPTGHKHTAAYAGAAALLWVFVISVAIAEAQGKLTVPPLTGRIVDQAALLDAAAEERISSRLAVLEADTGAQLAVLTIPSLQGEALEPFAIEVARTWALGQTGRDNGLLILVSRDDREVRIEVGRGLEGALTDLLTNRIIDERMVPQFREGDFGGGIEAAVEAMDPIIRGEPMPALETPSLGPLVGAIITTVLVIVMSVLGLAAMAVGGAFAWIVYLVMMPLAYGVPAASVNGLAGLSLFLLWAAGFPILYFTWGRRLRAGNAGKPRGRGRRSGSSADADDQPWGGWSGSSGRGSGGTSGGHSSGGGFSGGGGGFSGGGASGRW